MKKIFITGASGFVGANLVRKFIDEFEIHIFIRENSNLWRLNNLINHPNLKKHLGDLLNFNDLKRIIESINPDIIIHSAVYGGFPSENDSSLIMKTNFEGTKNLLEASREINYEVFVNTGSSSEYGFKNNPMKEEDILNPNTEYGISKAAATHFCSQFAKENKKSIITLRLFSPYGPFEDNKRLIPSVMKSALNKSLLEIGNPNSSRDFIFIDDVCEAYNIIINSDMVFEGEIFNVCSGKQYSVQEVIGEVSNLIGEKIETVSDISKTRLYDSKNWVGDNNKMRNEFYWEPKFNLREGLKDTLEWNKNPIKYLNGSFLSSKMKVSEYILEHLKNEGVKHAFLVIGGFIAPVVDAFDEDKNLKYICMTHEQGVSMAAEGYSRVSGNLGVGISTSGPGITNMMTGIACAYFDSIPVIYITGQVPMRESRESLEKIGKNGPRQVGFQETNVVDMVKPICKYAVRIENPLDIKYELSKAIHIAKSGRPGPVVIDLPMNIQFEEINLEELKEYEINDNEDKIDIEEEVGKLIELLGKSERPVVILGGGVKSSRTEKEVRELIEKLNIPVVVSWGAIDLLTHSHRLFVEGYGVAGNRVGNYTVQNADLILTIGTRLDTRQVGGKAETFAREAKKIVVDVDRDELFKGRGMEIDVGINSEIKDFVNVINKRFDEIKVGNISNWMNKINGWKIKYPICKREYYEQKDLVNPYVFLDVLSKLSRDDEILFTDTGNALCWVMQGFKVKGKQRVFSDLGHSAMGYSLPAAIGASFAENKRQILNIMGDGGFKLNINDLEVISLHNLPVKTFLMHNHGFGILKQFQDSWFGSRYKASSREEGLGDPDLLKISEGYGIKTVKINNHEELERKLKEVLDYDGPVVCSIEINEKERVIPKIEFGMPLEDPAPLLPLEELKEDMITEVHELSIKKREENES